MVVIAYVGSMEEHVMYCLRYGRKTESLYIHFVSNDDILVTI